MLVNFRLIGAFTRIIIPAARLRAEKRKARSRNELDSCDADSSARRGFVCAMM
jgi:hypothetical protein